MIDAVFFVVDLDCHFPVIWTVLLEDRSFEFDLILNTYRKGHLGVTKSSVYIELSKNMELQDSYYNKSEYVETASGNKVSRQTVLCGSQNIVLHGKVIVQSDAIIRGDLANVKTGRFCIISKGSVIRPPFKKFSKGVAFFPLQMGDHVFVGENTVVNAAVVGSYVYIGKNVVIGRRCVLKDCCMIEDNSVLPAETVVPSFARYSGNPARLITTLPEAMPDLMTEFTKSFYQHFLPTTVN